VAQTTRFRYTAYHPLTRAQLAPALHVRNPVWTEIANGNGAFTGSVAVPPDNDQLKRQILSALEPDESTILISSFDGKYPFVGIVTPIRRGTRARARCSSGATTGEHGCTAPIWGRTPT
jgi:hypothetical protein